MFQSSNHPPGLWKPDGGRRHVQTYPLMIASGDVAAKSHLYALVQAYLRSGATPEQRF